MSGTTVKKKTALTGIVVNEVSLVDSPAIKEKFKIAKAGVSPTQSSICSQISEMCEDGWCYELIEGNRAIVTMWSDGDYKTMSVPYSVSGVDVSIDMASASEVVLAWASPTVVQKSIASADLPGGIVSAILKRSGFQTPPQGCGAIPIPEEESMQVTAEDITKAVAAGVAPLVERINALEMPPALAVEKVAAEESIDIAAEVTKALQPVLDRINAIEKAKGVSLQPVVEPSTFEKSTPHMFAGIF